MLSYIIRRLFHAVPALIGVNLFMFFLFFIVNTPENMARTHLGTKHVSQEAIEQWIDEHGYNKPTFYNDKSDNPFTDTIFFEKSIRLFVFDFGLSDAGRSISKDIAQRMWPSLALAVPTFFVGIFVNISLALISIMFKTVRSDFIITFTLVALLSISYLFYIIAGQYLFAGLWQLVPVSGYQSGINSWRFLILPIAIGVFSGIGASTRWYRSIFMEVIDSEFIRTAKALGASELRLLFKHILPNAMIPILTGIIVLIPTLFMGNILMESFFGIPGLGSYILDGIKAQDFAVVRVMVFLGSILYIFGLIITDIVYTWVDPRIKIG